MSSGQTRYGAEQNSLLNFADEVSAAEVEAWDTVRKELLL
jgi:hypothetical protein